MKNIFETEEKPVPHSNQIAHLHRRLCLLVFALALLLQGLLSVEKSVGDYYQWLAQSFKIILTVEVPANQEQLTSWQAELAQQPEVDQVRVFSADEALAVVRHQNPQLVDSLLALGKNQMPPYFELVPKEQSFYNVGAWTDTLAAKYENLSLHYSHQQATLLFYTGLAAKLLRGLGILVLISFLAFMFLVEAAPYPQEHALSGFVAGLVAGLVAAGLLAAVLYPMGVLVDFWNYATSWHRQVLVLVFSGLMGWTLSKWQKF